MWPDLQTVHAQTWIRSTEWGLKNPLEFWNTNGSSYPVQKTRLNVINKKKIAILWVFCESQTENNEKLKENKNLDVAGKLLQ